MAVLTAERRSKAEDDADNDGEDVTKGGPERATDKNLAHVAQHVIAHAFGAGRVDVAVRDLQSAQRVHGESEQRCEDADFDHDPQNRGRGSFATEGWASVLPGSSLITPVALAMASTPESASTIPTKPAQFCQKLAVQRLEMADRFTDVRQTEKSEHDDNDRGRDRNKKRETAGLFRASKLSRPMTRIAARRIFPDAARRDIERRTER